MKKAFSGIVETTQSIIIDRVYRSSILVLGVFLVRFTERNLSLDDDVRTREVIWQTLNSSPHMDESVNKIFGLTITAIKDDLINNHDNSTTG
jgi:hypothetical protein